MEMLRYSAPTTTRYTRTGTPVAVVSVTVTTLGTPGPGTSTSLVQPFDGAKPSRRSTRYVLPATPLNSITAVPSALRRTRWIAKALDFKRGSVPATYSSPFVSPSPSESIAASARLFGSRPCVVSQSSGRPSPSESAPPGGPGLGAAASQFVTSLPYCATFRRCNASPVPSASEGQGDLSS